MNSKPVLLIDQDDVLAEYIAGVTEAFNEKYHTHFEVQDCNCWELSLVFGKEIDTVMHEPELFRKLVPTAHAVEVLQRLYGSELFEIYIVTAANPKCVEAKHEWLAHYFPFFPQNRVIVCAHKFMVKGDYLLDDGMHNLFDFARNGGVPVAFERPHNMHVEHRFATVKNWLEFERFIVETCYKEKSCQYFGFETEKVI